MKQFRKIGDKVVVWNFVEARFNNGIITAVGGHGGLNVYQVRQDNEARSQWYHNENEVWDRHEK